MSVSTKDLEVGDVLKLKGFPESLYVVIGEANDRKARRLLHLNNMTICRDAGGSLDGFLLSNDATKVVRISTLWRK